MAKKNKDIVINEVAIDNVVYDDVLSGFKAKEYEKQTRQDLCTSTAYDIIYNKTTRCYELVVVKYAPDTDLAYVEKTERLDADQVLAIDKLNRILDSKLLDRK